MRKTLATIMFLALATTAWSQDSTIPEPERKMLMSREGTWDLVMKMNGLECKGVMTSKMEIGGRWLVGSMETDLGGQKFFGKSLDSYDVGKKKFVGIWCDSMSSAPMIMEGTYDPAKKTMTMIGEGPGMDGKPTKWRSEDTMPDNNTVNLSMYVGDAKEPMFTITYKRK